MSSDSPSATPPLSPILVGKNKTRWTSLKSRDTNPIEERLTSSQNEDIEHNVTFLEQLEAVERDRKDRRKCFSKKYTATPVCLPVPSPIPTPCVVALNMDIPMPTAMLNDPLVIPEDFSGFRKGSGKEVLVPRQALEENLRLFEDILAPSQSSGTRTNKFNYLTRPDRDDSGDSPFKGFKEDEVRTAQLEYLTLKELCRKLSEEETKLDESNPRKRTRELEFDKCDGSDETTFKKPKVERFLATKPGFLGSTSCTVRATSKNSEGSDKQTTTQATSRSKLAFFDDLLKDQESYDDQMTRSGARNKGHINLSKESSFMFSIASGKPVKLSESSYLKANEVLKDFDLSDWNMDQEEVEIMENDSFPMFSSASGKPFKPAETAVHKAKGIFKDIDSFGSKDLKCARNDGDASNTEAVKKAGFPKFPSASGKPFKPSESAVHKAKGIFKDIESFDSRELQSPKNDGNVTSKETSENDSLPMFSIASGKPFKLSETAVHKAKGIFKDIDSFDSKELQSPKNEGNVTFKETSENDSFPMFSSASGKPFKPAETAVHKAKGIFKDIDSFDSRDLKSARYEGDTSNTEAVKKPGFPTFPSTSGKPFKLSESAVHKAKGILKDTDSFDSRDLKSARYEGDTSNTEAVEKAGFPTFPSASGKPFKLPEPAVHKAKGIFKDIDSFDSREVKSPKNDQNVTSKETSENHSLPMFSIASGKPFKLSESAVHKAKGIFKDIDNFDSRDLKSARYEGDTSNTEAVEKAGFPTFPSASGKPFKLSEPAVHKAKGIFKDIDSFDSREVKSPKNDQNVTSKETSENDSLPMFSIASGKPFKLSESAVHKAKGIFKDIDSFDSRDLKSARYEGDTSNTEAVEKAGFPTFPSASGKPFKLSEPAVHKAKGIFKDIDSFDSREVKSPKNDQNVTSKETSENDSLPMFSIASGKPFKLSESAVHKAKGIFKDIDNFDSRDPKSAKNDGDASNIEAIENAGFSTFSSASGKPFKPSEPAVHKAKGILKDTDSFYSRELQSPKNDGNVTFKETSENDSFPMFSCASGKPFKPSEPAVHKAKGIFKDIDSFDSRELQSPKNDGNVTFKETSENDSLPMFSIASEKPFKLSESAVHKAKGIFKDIDSFDPRDLKSAKNDGDASNIEAVEKAGLSTFSSASGKPFKPSETALHKVFKYIDNFDFKDLRSPAKEEATSFPEFSKKSMETLENSPKTNEINSNTPKSGNYPRSRSFSTPTNPTKPRRKLGMSLCKQIPIPNKTLLKASKLFDEDLTSISPIKPTINHSTPNNRKSFNSEKPGQSPSYNEKPGQSPIYNKTPGQSSICNKTPGQSSICNEKPGQSSICNEKPGQSSICRDKPSIIKSLFKETSTMEDGSFILTPTEVCNTKTWIENLEKHKQELQTRLEVITERQRHLIRIEQTNTVIDRKPRTGTLLQKKLCKPRIPLRHFIGTTKPDGTSNHPLQCITPQNAERFHFTMRTTPTVTTVDGCVVVPNPDDLVGLHEIDYSFRNVPGVEPSLISRDWIRNHYKWIVWKLAGYERTFPGVFDGVLCVENIIEQLKYRYDREIDRAERSALRKIFETDDVAQKRMVLCVSDIRLIEKDFGMTTFTLELTDGWYAIKTIIDEPLSNQIANHKLKIGTKLITCNAELLNCDGCHPLEATGLTSLRINYNCTRRAKWDDRLGYQDRLGPFPVQIESIDPNGGMVGLIRIVIVRAYPVKFLEKVNGQSVWRNKRAEERRAQEWENERHKQMERIYEEMQQRYDRSGHGESEDLRQELHLKIRDEMEKLDSTKRDLMPCFKLLVTDGNGDDTRTFNFWVWSPTDWHLEMLKEETSFMVYNIFPRKNGDLSTSKRTFFKPLPKRTEIPRVFKRRVTPINELNESVFDTFNEFDTIGLVVDVTVDKYQFVWLSDESGRLLLIKIFDSPRNCPLLDTVKLGQAITVCNLTFKKRHPGDITEAAGGSSTTFSMYSQYRHLQEGLDNFKANLPKNYDGLLDECSKRIKLFDTDVSDGFVSDEDEGTLTHSKLTRIDIALSMMDIDISTTSK